MYFGPNTPLSKTGKLFMKLSAGLITPEQEANEFYLDTPGATAVTAPWILQEMNHFISGSVRQRNKDRNEALNTIEILKTQGKWI